MKSWILVLILAFILVALVPFGVQAQESIKPLHLPYELVSLRTEDSKTYDLGNGYRQLVLSSSPVHYKDNYGDSQEQWKDIDLTIRDGGLTTAPYYLSIDGSTVTIVDKRTNSSVVLTLLEIDSSPVSSSFLPYVFKDNTAFIKDFALDTDLEIVATNEGVKFTRILKTDKAPLNAEFKIFKIGTGLQITYGAVDAGGASLKVTTSKAQDTVTETILSSELGEVVYPIRIDPSITIQPSTIDTTLKKDASTTNFGTWNRVELMCDQTSTQIHRGLVSFNISTIDPTWVVTNSTMILYYFASVGSNPVGRTVWAYKNIRSDWVETQATWVDYKTATNWTAAGGDYVTTAPIGGSSTVPAAFGYQNWNITAIVQDARDTALPLVHILLKDSTENSGGASNCQWQYRSREFGPTPQLVVTYVAAPTVNTIGYTDLACDYVNLIGNITNGGGDDTGTVGFEWGTTPGVYTGNFTWASGGIGTYGTSIYPAVYNTTYYFRFFAQNAAGRGNGTEMSFTTPWCTPDCPGNMTVTQVGIDSIEVTWDLGWASTNTTIVIKADEPPVDQYDGWPFYFGPGGVANMTGLELSKTTYYLTGYSSNPSGNSTCLTVLSIGGESMVFMGWMAFFGIFWLGTLWAASRWPEWLIKLANSLFAAAAWYYLYFGTTPPKLDYTNNTGIFLSFAFLILMMIPWLIQMNVWNRQEISKKGKGGLGKSISYESYGPKPGPTKNYNDAYWNRRADLRDRLQPRKRRR